MRNQITGSKLPSKRDVLSVLFYNMRQVNLNFADSASLVIDEVVVFWKKARIPTQHRSNCITKVKALYDELRILEKSAKRNTPQQKENETNFESNLDDLFDIATSSAVNDIKIPEDRDFLLLQRQRGRPGCMLGVDVKLARTEKRREERIATEEKRREKYAVQKPGCSSEKVQCVELSDDFGSSDAENDDCINAGDDFEDESANVSGGSEGLSRAKRGRKTMMTQRLAAALDKSKVSDRDAMHILSAVLDALSIDPCEYVLNRTSIKKSREKWRTKKYSIIKSSELMIDFVELHWDSKLLPDITQNKNIERLPVIAVSLDFEQLLGVPGIASGTGSEVCSAVFDIADDWSLIEKVQAFCFDTTASNTGRINGAAALLERKFGRNVLWMPCRHHIFEVVLADVFLQSKLIVTTGPNIALFHKFKNKWETIDKTKYLDFTTDLSVYNALKNISAEIITYAREKLAERQPRNDYKELLQLTLIFLGDKTNVEFKAPGAYHLARWMSKAIYCFKIFLFRDQFKLNKNEEKSVGEICVFLVHSYIKVWFSASDTVEAPLNDIIFLKNLVELEKVNKNIATIAIKKFLNHLWYLNDECAAFAIFDSRIESDVKVRMSERIVNYINADGAKASVDGIENEEEKEGEEGCAKKLSVNMTNLKNFILMDLPTELLSPSSLNLFKRFNISTDFLYNEPAKWELNEQYQKGKRILSALKCVNDIAERGVKLMEEFNEKFTKNEEQKQFLLQVVQEYRKKYPSFTKTSLFST